LKNLKPLGFDHLELLEILNLYQRIGEYK